MCEEFVESFNSAPFADSPHKHDLPRPGLLLASMQTYSRSSMQATSDQADATSSSTLTLHVDVHCIDDQQLRCPMCARHFRQPVRLDCGHSFCRACIDRWLRRCNACSICRQPTLQPRRNEDLEKVSGNGTESWWKSAGFRSDVRKMN